MQYIHYLHINSKNRSHGSSHNFLIQLHPAISTVKSVNLLALSLPITNYTINSYNNLIYFTDGVTDFTATITSGIYNSDNIVLAIKTAIEATAIVGTITVMFLENTYKLTITSTTNFALQFATYTTNSANYIMGFDEVDTASALSHEGNNSINLSIPSCIFVKINEFPTNCRSSNDINGTFPIYIYINTISGEINFYFPNSQFNLVSNNIVSYLNNLIIQLINPDTGYLFDIQDSEWSMLLALNY
jgi:hypothetical protein